MALSLNWMRLPGAESCIDAADLARSVERHLGYAVFVSPTVATRIIEAWIEPARPGWHVGLRASNANGDPLGQRELTSPDANCSSLDRAIVIAVGLLAQEAEGATVALPPPVPLAPAAIPPRLGLVAPPFVRPDRPPFAPQQRATELRAELGPAFTMGWGVLPGTALGISMQTAIRLPQVGLLDFGSRLWFPEFEGDPEAMGSFSRIDVALGWCPFVAGSEASNVGICAGLMSGAVTAQGVGSGGSNSVARGLLETYGRMIGHFRVLAPLWITGTATLGVPLARRTFYHRLGDGSEIDIWAMPAVTGSAEIGLLLHFGP